MLFTQLHRRSAKAVLCEHSTYGCAGIQCDDRQVFAVGFAHTGFGDTNLHTGYRMQIFRASYV
jgi:hypothetical protein